MSSLPKRCSNPSPPALSSSSSKTSLRAQHLQPELSSRPRLSQPQHQTQSNVVASNANLERLHFSGGYAAENRSEDTRARSRPPEQPRFEPFFTLIEDVTTLEHFHPSAVHYIFSDDDTDIVTEAVLRSLETDYELPADSKAASQREKLDSGVLDGQLRRDGDGASRSVTENDTSRLEDEPRSPHKLSLLPPPIPGVRDNYIILDVEPTSTQMGGADEGGGRGGKDIGSVSTSSATQTQNRTSQGRTSSSSQFRVTSAHSLSPAWQVVNTEIVRAPTFDNNNSNGSIGDNQVGSTGLMLKIQGARGLPANLPKDKDRDFNKGNDKPAAGLGAQRLEEMMDQFAKRMILLRRIIDAGQTQTPQQAASFDDKNKAKEEEAPESPEDHPSSGYHKPDQDHEAGPSTQDGASFVETK